MFRFSKLMCFSSILFSGLLYWLDKPGGFWFLLLGLFFFTEDEDMDEEAEEEGLGVFQNNRGKFRP